MNNVIIKTRLILKRNHKVLLLAQTSKNGGKFTLVGGRVEDEEYVKRALIRECQEEIGIHLTADELDLVHVLHKKVRGENRLTLYFMAEDWKGVIHSRETKKFKGVAWFSIYELPPKTSTTVRHVLEQVKMGERYSELSKR